MENFFFQSQQGLISQSGAKKSGIGDSLDVTLFIEIDSSVSPNVTLGAYMSHTEFTERNSSV